MSMSAQNHSSPRLSCHLLHALVEGSPPSTALLANSAASEGASLVTNRGLLLVCAPAREILRSPIHDEIRAAVDGKASYGQN